MTQHHRDARCAGARMSALRKRGDFPFLESPFVVKKPNSAPSSPCLRTASRALLLLRCPHVVGIAARTIESSSFAIYLGKALLHSGASSCAVRGRGAYRSEHCCRLRALQSHQAQASAGPRPAGVSQAGRAANGPRSLASTMGVRTPPSAIMNVSNRIYVNRAFTRLPLRAGPGWTCEQPRSAPVGQVGANRTAAPSSRVML